MGLTIEDERAPLEISAEGVVRVGGTRVTLDTVVAAFEQGATPEEIAQQYPVLHLADVYATVGYYLRHRSEVESYLRVRQKEADDARNKNVPRFEAGDVRARLLARHSK